MKILTIILLPLLISCASPKTDNTTTDPSSRINNSESNSSNVFKDLQ